MSKKHKNKRDRTHKELNNSVEYDEDQEDYCVFDDLFDFCAKCGAEHGYMNGPCEYCGSREFTKTPQRVSYDATSDPFHHWG